MNGEGLLRQVDAVNRQTKALISNFAKLEAVIAAQNKLLGAQDASLSADLTSLKDAIASLVVPTAEQVAAVDDAVVGLNAIKESISVDLSPKLIKSVDDLEEGLETTIAALKDQLETDVTGLSSDLKDAINAQTTTLKASLLKQSNSTNRLVQATRGLGQSFSTNNTINQMRLTIHEFVLVSDVTTSTETSLIGDIGKVSAGLGEGDDVQIRIEDITDFYTDSVSSDAWEFGFLYVGEFSSSYYPLKYKDQGASVSNGDRKFTVFNFYVSTAFSAAEAAKSKYDSERMKFIRIVYDI